MPSGTKPRRGVFDWQQEIQVIEDRPILDAAVALADDGKLPEAIAEARKIQADRALHNRARSLIDEWTTAIQIAEDKPLLDEAKDLAYVGSLTAAINLASQIAPGRALYDEASAGHWPVESRTGVHLVHLGGTGQTHPPTVTVLTMQSKHDCPSISTAINAGGR